MAVRAMKVLLALSVASIDYLDLVLLKIAALNHLFILFLPELQLASTEGSGSPGRKLGGLQC